MTNQNDKKQEGYDYQALRDKIRKSWGLEETSEKESQETENKPDVTENKEAVAAGSGRDNQKADKLHKKSVSTYGTFHQYPKTQESEKSSLKRTFPRTYEKPKKDPYAFHEKKIKSAEASYAERGIPPVRHSHLRKKSMVRQWILYQTILGRPRSLDPWKPYENRR